MNFVCKFVGGTRDGLMSYEDACWCCDGRSEDLTEARKRGACVHRPELDNQPTFDGYCGPMWDGTTTIDGEEYGILRYETWEVYDMLSR